MRRRKSNIENINNQIILIGIIFIVFIILGTYLNKIWTMDKNDISNNINSVIEYYNSDIISKEVIISNLKTDVIFMLVMVMAISLVITLPIAIIIFMLKGMSIGYTINSCIVAAKFKSIKIISIILIKNCIIIPALIILIIISLNYLKEVISSLKKINKDNILFLCTRYLLNGAIITIISVLLQFLINIVGINIISFLAR